MENREIKINIMGSEVVDGYICKPKKLVPNKPIMHFKTHLFLCEGERCKKASKNENLTTHLREILKELNLHIGSNRIKISRSGCYGACRFRGVMNIYENTRANGYIENNNIWLKSVHRYDEKKWRELFIALSENGKLNNFEQIVMDELD